MLTPAGGDSRVSIGVSLKMYFGHQQAIDWARRIGEIAATHPAVRSGVAELFVIPSFPSLVPVRDAIAAAGGTVALGAQDMFWEDNGAYTGEVSGVELAELGTGLVEIGHAERRALFHEDDAVIARKVSAAYRTGLVPLLCVGELEKAPPAVAALEVAEQLRAALADADAAAQSGAVLVAYEPQWAIGAPEPAAADYVAEVVASIDDALAQMPLRAGSRVIYGGSAGPGLLTRLAAEQGGDRIGGLFLGRFAHDPEAVAAILDEAALLSGGQS
ncbi:MAG: triose-phosphate isomerase family protein [Mycetocola sp.]